MCPGRKRTEKDRAIEITLPPGPGNVKNEMCSIAPHRIDMGIKAAWFQLFTLVVSFDF